MLYEWCEKYNVSYKRIGKYIVACNEDEAEQLEKIRLNAMEAGLDDLKFVTPGELKKNEPSIASSGALFSPSTGIVSAHELMTSMKNRAFSEGADFLFNSEVVSAEKMYPSGGYRTMINDSNSGETVSVECEHIINCAGLYSDAVAETLNVKDERYKLRFVKGNYFRLAGCSNLFSHLIYPVPDKNSSWLGTHITLDLAGGVRLGPDSENMDEKIEDYSVDPARLRQFFDAARRFFPAVRPEWLSPDMCGIRPRLAISQPENDFIISEEKQKGLPGIINCIGIESPGLTSSLAIAEFIHQNLYY
jgi:L-2-hydroxyglutarate oxidase LhgO